MGLGQSKEDKASETEPKQTKVSANPNFGLGEPETNFVERNVSKNVEEDPSNPSSPARQPTKDTFNATTSIASRANSQRVLRSHSKRNVTQSGQRKSIKRSIKRRHVKDTHRDERNGPKYSTRSKARSLSTNRKRKSQSYPTFSEDCFVPDNSLENNANEDVECVVTRSSKADNSSEFILPSQPPSPPNIRPAAPMESLVESLVEIRSTHAVDSDVSSESVIQSRTDNTTKKFKKNNKKYTIENAVDLVIKNKLTVPEALRVTLDVCTRQYLYRAVKKRKKEIVEGEHAGKVIGAVDTRISSISSSLSPQLSVMKKSRKSTAETNERHIEEKRSREDFKKRYDLALKEAILLWSSTKETREKRMHDPKYIGLEKSISTILNEVNKKYLSDDSKRLTKGTFFRYFNNEIKELQPRGPPPLLPKELLNAVRLHIKILQLSRKSQASGPLIQRILAAATHDTEYAGCSTKSAWLRIRKEFPEEIRPCTVSTVDSLRSEWTTFTKVNDWFSENKKTLIDSGLAIDEPITLEDGTVSELTIGERESARIVNFDETDHPLSTEYDKGGNNALRYGDPQYPKGAQRGTRNSVHTKKLFQRRIGSHLF